MEKCTTESAKKAIPLGTFSSLQKRASRDTWKHLENEGKARSLIRTVPDKCPNKELYAEFVLLRLVEVCEVAQTTKKGWTDKGWAQCRFELVPMFGSHLYGEGERDELVLNILVEAAFHRLRVSKLAPSDGTGIKIHMRYDGFRSRWDTDSRWRTVWRRGHEYGQTTKENRRRQKFDKEQDE